MLLDRACCLFRTLAMTVDRALSRLDGKVHCWNVPIEGVAQVTDQL